MEIKVAWKLRDDSADARNAQITDTRGQLQEYVRRWVAFDESSAERYQLPEEIAADRFLIDYAPGCVTGNALRGYEYTTSSVPGPQNEGVLIVDRTPITCANAGTTFDDHVAAPGYEGYLGRDEDGNGRDDFFDWLVAHEDEFPEHSGLIEHLPQALASAQAVRVYLSQPAVSAFLSSWSTLLAAETATGSPVAAAATRTLAALIARVLAVAVAPQATLVITAAAVFAAVTPLIADLLRSLRSWNVWG